MVLTACPSPGQPRQNPSMERGGRQKVLTLTEELLITVEIGRIKSSLMKWPLVGLTYFNGQSQTQDHMGFTNEDIDQ